MHVYSNIVTVDLAKGATSDGLADVVRYLYQYWKPGMAPAGVRGPPARGGRLGRRRGLERGGDAGGDAALAEAAKRVPMHLLERGRAARERWKAKQG